MKQDFIDLSLVKTGDVVTRRERTVRRVEQVLPNNGPYPFYLVGIGCYTRDGRWSSEPNGLDILRVERDGETIMAISPAQEWKDGCAAHIAALFRMAGRLSDKGDKGDVCQKVVMTIALNGLAAVVAGVKDEDLEVVTDEGA